MKKIEMKNIGYKKGLLTLFFIVFVYSGFSQNRKELEIKKEKAEEEIKITNQLLEETEKSKSLGLNKLLIIKKRISLREQLIGAINDEIDLLDKNILKRNAQIEKHEQDIKQLKEEYAKMIYFAYKNKNNYDRLMFILSAEDFNQSYRRMKYFQQYTNYRKHQAEQIIITQKNLEYEIEQIKEQKNEKVQLLARKEKEKFQLHSENEKENTEIDRLKQRERELRKKISENEKIMKRLENAITELIAKETAANKNSKTLGAKEGAVSIGFQRAMGKLNWPIENGIITSEFGEHPHPVIKGVMINSNGVDISTTKDAKVKAIYEGEVKRVVAVPGANMAVIIRHGHYLSLYSNIVNVLVKPGDNVAEGQSIGDLYYSKNSNEGSVLHLQIYQEMQALNPKIWLGKR